MYKDMMSMSYDKIILILTSLKIIFIVHEKYKNFVLTFRIVNNPFPIRN